MGMARPLPATSPRLSRLRFSESLPRRVAKRLVRRLAPRCREPGVPMGAGVSLRSSRWLTLGVEGSEDE